MSVSLDCSDTINLFCNETASELVSLETENIEIQDISSSSSDDNEGFIDGIFDSELDQMLDSKLITRFLEFPDVRIARQDAVNWMLKVHAYYNFRPETAYLSVNYLDRLISFHSLPEGKGWPMQLLAVACLSVAAKLEETNVPILLDLQILEPRFLFKSNTIQRMELLVMAKLKWRLQIITPFYFLRHFIAKLSPVSTDPVFSQCSELLINICRVINFLDYTPSAVAAAVVFWVTNQSIDDSKLDCLHEKLNNEMVKRCYNVVKKNMSKLSHSKVIDGTLPRRCHAKKFCVKGFKTRSSPVNRC